MKAYQFATVLAASVLLVVAVHRLFPQTGQLIMSAASVLLRLMALLKA